MKEIDLSYSDFKTYITNKQLMIQYIQSSTGYTLFAIEAGVICWQANLIIGTDDSNDFESNHKSTANAPLEIKAATGRPLRVSASPQPSGTVEHWKGYKITIPAGQTSGYVDISFPSTVYIKGGYIISADVDLDDSVEVDVLIAANSAMYISGLISNANMIPNSPVSFESDESMMFPTSLKLRVTLNTSAPDASDTHANILVDYFI